MNAKTIIPVLLFAAVMPSVTNAATVDHYSARGAFESTYFSTSDNCTYSEGFIDFSENTTPDIPLPRTYVWIYSYNSCILEGDVWLLSTISNLTLSHTPSTHNSFPNSLSASADFVLTNSLGNTKTIHVQLNFVSVGARYEFVDKIQREYPSVNKHAVKLDIDGRSHQSAATGLLSISGDFQYNNASQSGFIGVGTFRTLTITH